MDKILDTGEIDIVDIHLTQQASRCRDHDIRAALQAGYLCAPCSVILAAVDSHGREGHIEAETLHLLVDLLR